MTPLVVCDASAVVAILLDSGLSGRWATDALTQADLAAPSLLPFEAATIIRRHELAGVVSADQAAEAHAHLTTSPSSSALRAPRSPSLATTPQPHAYDAGYVALAELLEVTLVTLDLRIARAPDIRCTVATP